MDAIALTRQLGAALQQDERYLKLMEAQKVNEEDEALNELIAKLRLVQMNFQHEASKDEKDDARLQQLDTEFGQLYNQVMANPNMQAYEAAAAEIDELMKYITGILQLCLQGEDPETCEPHVHDESCGGDCSGCSGCH